MNPKQQKLIIERLATEHYNKNIQAAKEQVSRAFMAATLITLHDKHQFTPYSLKKIMIDIFDQFDSVCEKYVTIEDFYKELEGMGIEVKEG